MHGSGMEGREAPQVLEDGLGAEPGRQKYVPRREFLGRRVWRPRDIHSSILLEPHLVVILSSGLLRSFACHLLDTSFPTAHSHYHVVRRADTDDCRPERR